MFVLVRGLLQRNESSERENMTCCIPRLCIEMLDPCYDDKQEKRRVSRVAALECSLGLFFFFQLVLMPPLYKEGE